jgi:hypothetical protein
MDTIKLPDYVTPEYLATLTLCRGAGNGSDSRCGQQEINKWLGLDPKSYEIRPHDASVAEVLMAGVGALRGLPTIIDSETLKAAKEPLEKLALDRDRALADTTGAPSPVALIVDLLDMQEAL